MLLSAPACVFGVLRDPSGSIWASIRPMSSRSRRRPRTYKRSRSRAERDDLIERMIERFERDPRVVAAGAVLQRPFEHGPIGWDTSVLLEGQVNSPDVIARNPTINFETVTPDYFRAMGIRLIRGRVFYAARQTRVAARRHRERGDGGPAVARSGSDRQAPERGIHRGVRPSRHLAHGGRRRRDRSYRNREPATRHVRAVQKPGGPELNFVVRTAAVRSPSSPHCRLRSEGSTSRSPSTA